MMDHRSRHLATRFTQGAHGYVLTWPWSARARVGGFGGFGGFGGSSVSSSVSSGGTSGGVSVGYSSARPAGAIALTSPAPILTGMADTALYPAGYPIRLRGDARSAGGSVAAMATLSYHKPGSARRFGADPRVWITSHMAMHVEAHGERAFR